MGIIRDYIFGKPYVAPKPSPVERAIVEAKRPAKTVRSVQEVVEEIHETFYTEVDRLLADAKIAHSLDTDKQGLIDKCERLKKLGFAGSSEVAQAQSEIVRLTGL